MKKIIDYLLEKKLAEIPKRGRKHLKQIIINNQKFRYNKDKPLSKKMQKKTNISKKTPMITEAMQTTKFH